MKNSRLYQLFSNLNDTHLREMRKWVRSPIYNSREDVILLFDLLAKNKRSDKPAPSKSQAFEKVYKRATYNDGQLRLTMTFLLKNIEQYLTQKAIFEKVNPQIELASIYRKLNLPKHFEGQLKKLESTQANSATRDAFYYENNHLVALEKYQFAAQSRRREDVHLQEVSKQLDISYFSRKLQHACFALAHKTIYHIDYELTLIPEILEQVVQQDWLEYPAISIYYYCYRALSEAPDSGWFDQFRAELEKQKNTFPEEELRTLYLAALNFCIRQYNAGNPAYLQVEFDLYRESLEGSYLYSDGYLSRFTYRNILSVCLAVGDLMWAKQFIDEYLQKVEPQYQESAYSFNKARLEYRQKNYQEALLLLQKSEFNEFFTNFSAKIIMLKIYFETEEFDVLESQIASMKAFLNRQKDIGYHKENYANFLKSTSRIIRLPLGDKAAKASLRAEIKDIERIAERAWLLAILS